MNWHHKKEALQGLYDRFDADAHPFKKDAICKLGCTYCCTDVGNVDTNTLEGLIIRERIEKLPRETKNEIGEKLSHHRQEKKNGPIAPCPFLEDNSACLIYDVRPFSCRQLYSIRECRGRGPTVHRQVVALAKKAVREMQQLDDTGYSGHLGHILYLLKKPGFRDFYLAGGFDPGRIMAFGKAHGIIINRFAK
jgi:Fe-S-cluster containining protein